MATPCNRKVCPPHQKFDAASCSCKDIPKKPMREIKDPKSKIPKLFKKGGITKIKKK